MHNMIVYNFSLQRSNMWWRSIQRLWQLQTIQLTIMRDRSMTNSLHLPLLDTQICSTLPPILYLYSKALIIAELLMLWRFEMVVLAIFTVFFVVVCWLPECDSKSLFYDQMGGIFLNYKMDKMITCYPMITVCTISSLFAITLTTS